MEGFRPVRWAAIDPEPEIIYIDLCNWPDGSELYAVRRRGSECLNKNGKWEVEPVPSERGYAFMERCRFETLDDASRAAVRAARGAHTKGKRVPLPDARIKPRKG